MTCRNTRRPALSEGYTFLELAIALGLIAIVFVAVFPTVSASHQERRLRGAMEAIGQEVRERRREAEMTGMEQSLVVTTNGLAAREKSALRTVTTIPEGVALALKYPGGEWEAAKEQTWRIFSMGVVQPLSLRLQQGDSWIEADYDFLTGGMAAERYSF